MQRILVVEDEPAIALGLKNDLSLEGYEVEVARDGETGFARAAAGGFDLGAPPRAASTWLCWMSCCRKRMASRCAGSSAAGGCRFRSSC